MRNHFEIFASRSSRLQNGKQNLSSYVRCGKIKYKIQDLRELKDKWSKEVYDAVATSSLEMNEDNASGRYPVWELWNFRQARLKEVAEYVLQKLKAFKGAKRRT
ncbi:hypothetical protein MKX03_024284 [Papaver bracteatum]|nr:hypothetical protein MKX03_024284 [Papaver bracteatum]